MSDPLRPVPGETLGEVPGTIHVTRAAAGAYADATHTTLERAYEDLARLLPQARSAGMTSSGATRWRHRSRTTGLDMEAHVVREGDLLKVVHLRVRSVPYRPPPGQRPRRRRG